MQRLFLALGLVFTIACRSTQAPSEAAAPQPVGLHAQAVAAPAQTFDDGALRNARVALARGADRPELTYFAREMTPAEQAEVAALAPRLRVVTGLDRNEAVRRAAEAHGADASYASPEFLSAAPNLVWLQAQSAGVDRYMTLPGIRDADRIVLTNLRGVHGPAIADHVFAMLLALTRDLPVHLAGRERGAWQRDGSNVLEPIALEGRTLLVVGLGGIGSEIARRGHGFGRRFTAPRRSDAPAPEFVERVVRSEQLLWLLPEADVVAIAVPLTPETHHLFDARAFAAMKRGAYLVNIARGQVVDTEALVAALRSGRVAGACLDVTDPEPLPGDHVLWSFPNVVITPHVAARAELTSERGWALFKENLRRFDAGEPLLNVVDKKAGY
jgi:phosphoglycerate dehydrogenase-like enzyme